MYNEGNCSPREEIYDRQRVEIIENYNTNDSEYDKTQNSRNDITQTIGESVEFQGGLHADSEIAKSRRRTSSPSENSLNLSTDHGEVLELVQNNPNAQGLKHEQENNKNSKTKRQMKSWEFGDRYSKKGKLGPDFGPSVPPTRSLKSMKFLAGGPKPLNRLKKKDGEERGNKHARSDVPMSKSYPQESRYWREDYSNRRPQLGANFSHRTNIGLERLSKRSVLKDSENSDSTKSGSSLIKSLNHAVPELRKVELMRIKKRSRCKAEKLSSDVQLITSPRIKKKNSNPIVKENRTLKAIVSDENDNDPLDDECSEVDFVSSTSSIIGKREKTSDNVENLGFEAPYNRSGASNLLLINKSRQFISEPRSLPDRISKGFNDQANAGRLTIANQNSSSPVNEYSEVNKAQALIRNNTQQSIADLSIDEISVAHFDEAPKKIKSTHFSRNDVSHKRRATFNDDFGEHIDLELSSDSVIQTGKNNLSSTKVNPYEKIYSVQQVFCKSKLWLSPPCERKKMDYQGKWTLHLDLRKKILKICNEDNEAVPGLSLGRVNSILASTVNGKMLINKPISTQDPVGTHRICLELMTSMDSQNFIKKLKKCDPNVFVRYKEHDQYFERVFEHTLKCVKSAVTRSTSEKMESNSPSRAQEDEGFKMMNTKTSHKIQDTVSKTLTHLHRPTGLKTIAQSMTTRSQKSPIDGRKLDTSTPILSNSPQSPEEVRSEKEKDLSPETSRCRTRTRLCTTHPSNNHATPDSVHERWTKSNPNWKKKWYTSIVYPPVGKNKATVDCADIDRLDEGEFINDNLMMFYLRWLQQKTEQESPEIAKRIYFHNTFFYERLTSIEKGKFGINYENVERWTSRVKLFEYDYIVVPVNENFHWYVALICNAPKLLEEIKIPSQRSESAKGIQGGKIISQTPAHIETISSQSSLEIPSKYLPSLEVDMGMNMMTLSNHSEEGFDSETDPVLLPNLDTELASVVDSKKRGRKRMKLSTNTSHKNIASETRIITLDSFGRSHSLTCTNLKKYLLKEIESKLNIKIDDPGNLGKTAKNIPQQDNFSDCGLFVLSYIEIFLRNPDKFVSDLLQNKFPDDVRWKKPSKMRANIRKLLFKLQSEYLELAVKQNKVDSVEKDISNTSKLSEEENLSCREELYSPERSLESVAAKINYQPPHKPRVTEENQPHKQESDLKSGFSDHQKYSSERRLDLVIGKDSPIDTIEKNLKESIEADTHTSTSNKLYIDRKIKSSPIKSRSLSQLRRKSIDNDDITYPAYKVCDSSPHILYQSQKKRGVQSDIIVVGKRKREFQESGYEDRKKTSPTSWKRDGIEAAILKTISDSTTKAREKYNRGTSRKDTNIIVIE